jgi:hypothetical protein
MFASVSLPGTAALLVIRELLCHVIHRLDMLSLGFDDLRSAKQPLIDSHT